MFLFKTDKLRYVAQLLAFLTGSKHKKIGLATRALLAFCLASPFTAFATTYIPSVTVACTTCVTYQDLMDKARNTAQALGWGNVTPPGYPAGTFPRTNFTKILVSATTVPRSYAFQYQAHVHRCVACFDADANIFTYTVTPITTYADATDEGATSMDGLIYKALRKSGLPTINVPPFDTHGNPIDSNSEADVITSAVTLMMPAVGIPGTLKTLPGLFNWTLFPSITVIYQGKSYTLYEGEELNIKFSDGTTLTLIVTVGGYGGSPGIFRVKSSAPVSVNAPSTSQPGISLNLFDPNSNSYAGNAFFVWGSYFPSLTGVVVSGQLTTYVDIGP